MAIKINTAKKGGSQPSATTTSDEAELSGLGNAPAASAPSETSPETNSPPPASQGMVGHQTNAGFLMTGNSQQTAVERVRAQQDLRSKLRGGPISFWLDPGQFAKLYFLDGKLLSEGVFDTPMVATHFLQIGGEWVRFICNNATEGTCVVCESNAQRTTPDTLQLFTVINLTPYKIAKGPRAGQVIPARLQLFAATLKVREKLLKRAEKCGGTLAGNLFTFSRSTQTDPRTGEEIEHEGAYPMEQVVGKYPKLGPDPKGKNADGGPTQPYDYAKVFPVLTNAEIAQLRPDLAGMAGYSVGAPAGGMFSPPVGDIGDDELPF